MSATNRGSDREARDNYPTPNWLIQAILPYIMPNEDALLKRKNNTDYHPFSVLEPACGKGNILNEIAIFARNNYKDESVALYGIDIYDYGMPGTVVSDFLNVAPIPIYDLIITNPPYSLAMEFITHSMKFMRELSSMVVMLLRLSFLGSKKRAKWLRSFVPNIYVTPRRPQFVNGQSDNCEYAWFVWGQEPKPIVFLQTENS